MRSILVLLLAFGAAGVAASSFDDSWVKPARNVTLFKPDRTLRGQLIDDSGPPTTELPFGAGIALGLDSNALGLGVSGWFDYYFAPWLSAGARTSVSYGVLGRRYKDGGDAVAFTLGLGAKFTFDSPDWEWSKWVRPWVALYPAGFQFLAATEDFDPPGSDDHDHISYSDVFYHVSGGVGVDFYLTSLVGVGIAFYGYGSIGGSRHDDNDTDLRTKGHAGFYIEFARLSLRF